MNISNLVFYNFENIIYFLVAIPNAPINNRRPCSNGLHLTMSDLLDLGQYERRQKGEIRRFYGRDGKRDCGICQDVVLEKRLSRNRRFAILERCEHCFCATCIEEWRNTHPERGVAAVSCPMCRQVSEVAYRRVFYTIPEIKRKIFQDRHVRPNGGAINLY